MNGKDDTRTAEEVAQHIREANDGAGEARDWIHFDAAYKTFAKARRFIRSRNEKAAASAIAATKEPTND